MLLFIRCHDNNHMRVSSIQTLSTGQHLLFNIVYYMHSCEGKAEFSAANIA